MCTLTCVHVITHSELCTWSVMMHMCMWLSRVAEKHPLLITWTIAYMIGPELRRKLTSSGASCERHAAPRIDNACTHSYLTTSLRIIPSSPIRTGTYTFTMVTRARTCMRKQAHQHVRSRTWAHAHVCAEDRRVAMIDVLYVQPNS